MSQRQILCGATIFDGRVMHQDSALVVEQGRIAAILPQSQAPEADRIWLNGGTLAPGFIDLQVNGGGGRMLDGTADVPMIREICAAHLRLGATGILSTLITDRPDAVARVVAAGIDAAHAGVPGFLGLHLEGPHLDPGRAGAHDPTLIRPMQADDLQQLCEAARALPVLMVTLAPASATADQIAALVTAGVVVSIGHSDATDTEAQAAFAAGAACVTHLFNAMSQIGNRAPGLAGAALASDVAAGIIADGLHVAPAVLRIALAARPKGLFLVSDAMAVAGTDLTGFRLGSRRVLRQGGRLVLEDGTLAGADLSLPQAVRLLIRTLAIAPERALAMASSIPAKVIGADDRVGRIAQGRVADIVHLTSDWVLDGVWCAGKRVE